MTSRAPVLRLYHDEPSADLFAGGGGASTGATWATGKSPDVAINHDEIALAVHEENHPTTEHLRGDVFHYDPDTVAAGRRFGFAWFSPDCTFHSKAKGGVPFRDKRKAVRIRGLAWVIVRWAESRVAKPRVIFMENVEEIQDWGPLVEVSPGEWRPDPKRRGTYWRRLVRHLERAGYVVEAKRLRASDYGAPTSRRRLVMVARCDGLPIVWPAPTHGPHVHLQPFRTAAECIDFSLPVPSIFLTPDEAKAWGKAHGLLAPRRPLRDNTLRRVARGVMRYVVDCADPFIVSVDRGEHRGSAAPLLMNNSELRGDRVYRCDEPARTLTAMGCRTYQLVVPTLINTRNGERIGQEPRIRDIREPYATVTAHGSQGALVAAFLAKHNAGHEATGQRLAAPVDTLTCTDSKALVTSHLVKLRGGLLDHVNTAQDVREPAPTLTAGGTHVAEIRAFLVKFYGQGVARSLFAPADTITTRDRYGLVIVTIAGEDYVLVDIGMRMLTPRELFLLQGFSPGYQIESAVIRGKRVRLTKSQQTRLVGNSVPPHMAAAVVAANLDPGLSLSERASC